MTRDHELDATFSALADPTRRAIISRLAEGPASVGELAQPFDISLPAISRHLRVLEGAGLIKREKDAQWRRCHLQPQGLTSAADWIDGTRRFWEGRLDQLARCLKAPETPSKEKQHGRNPDNGDPEPGGAEG